jgi:predicted nucleotidyltransferase
MSSRVQRAYELKLITPPSFLPTNMVYEVLMGSSAYGCSDDNSDMDIWGCCIPPKNMVFPHLTGEVFGFGKEKKRFEQWQEHHIEDKDKNCQYDFSISSIVKFFSLAMDSNPDKIDALFVPQRCILHTTSIGNMIRENRKLFLSKGCFFKLKGYSYSQLHKMRIKNPEMGSKRRENIERVGFDSKFGYHVVRLILECEQILTEYDLDLERNREQLKAIRRGDWKEEDIYKFFSEKEQQLEKLYSESHIPNKPDESKIRNLLMDCLETHYGSLENCVVRQDNATRALNEISEILVKYNIK